MEQDKNLGFEEFGEEINLGGDDFDEIDDPFAVPDEFISEPEALEEQPEPPAPIEQDIQMSKAPSPTATPAESLKPTPPQTDSDDFLNDPDLNSMDLEKELSSPKPPKATPKAAPKPANPLAAAMEDSDNAIETAKHQNIFAKLPQFDYSGIQEDIEDTSITFEALRKAKADDFPELQDATKVSWRVQYGVVTQTITNVGKTTIAQTKTEIETSKRFIDGLKKAKKEEEKDPICKVTPVVSAQKKGKVSAYKGVFVDMDEAEKANKLISIVPASDGNVYEIRKTELGVFTTPTKGHKELSDIRAGFNPALPQISSNMLWGIIGFFRKHSDENDAEVLINIYWDNEDETFIADCPEQTVSKVSVDAVPGEKFQNSRYLHYMDIHSHNTMDAFFSAIDDRDEKATRLYGVIGRLDKFLPDMKVRICNGGNFLEIYPGEIFEGFTRDFFNYREWTERIKFANRKETLGKLLEDDSTDLFAENFMGGDGYEYPCK